MRPTAPAIVRRLRIAALAVLVTGIVAAGAVYAFETPPAESDDPATIASDKIDSREVEHLFGGVGLLGREWTQDLAQPENQAALIAVVAVLVAGGCFGVAGFLDRRLARHPHQPPAG
jgi:hypothetical protein